MSFLKLSFRKFIIGFFSITLLVCSTSFINKHSFSHGCDTFFHHSKERRNVNFDSHFFFHLKIAFASQTQTHTHTLIPLSFKDTLIESTNHKLLSDFNFSFGDFIFEVFSCLFSIDSKAIYTHTIYDLCKFSAANTFSINRTIKLHFRKQFWMELFY